MFDSAYFESNKYQGMVSENLPILKYFWALSHGHTENTNTYDLQKIANNL